MEEILLFILGMLIGVFLEVLFEIIIKKIMKKPFRVNHKFTLSKRISLFSIPIWGFLSLLFMQSNSLILVFIFSVIIGTFLEGSMGKLVSNVYGTKIWTYKKGSIGGFTSIYSIPYWGAAGVIFASIGKLLGL